MAGRNMFKLLHLPDIVLYYYVHSFRMEAVQTGSISSLVVH